MTTRLFAIITLAVMTSGCAHIFKARQVHQIDRNSPPSAFKYVTMKTRGTKGSVALTSGDTVEGQYIQVARDSSFWYDPFTGRKRTVPTSEMSKIVIVKRGRGAWEGFKLGALIGIPVGAVCGCIEKSETERSTGERAGLGVATGIFYGGAFGAAMGWSIGFKDEFIFIGPSGSPAEKR